MADAIDYSTGCPVRPEIAGDTAERANLTARLRMQDDVYSGLQYPAPASIAGPAVARIPPESISLGSEIGQAAAHIEDAAARGNHPSEQALLATNGAVEDYFARRDGSSQISDLNVFIGAVLLKVDRDKPGLVNGMALSWAAHGDSIGGSPDQHCVNWAHTGIAKNQLDKFSQDAQGSGFLSSFMANRVEQMWPSLNPAGGSALNLVGMGEYPSVTQKTIEQKIEEINARLEASKPKS